MAKFAVTTRVLGLYYAGYKFITDASFIQSLDKWTRSTATKTKTAQLTETQSSLLFVTLLLLATTDLIPLIEGNQKYFTSMAKFRMWTSALVGSALYFGIITPWVETDLIVYFFGVEMMLNTMIWTEGGSGGDGSGAVDGVDDDGDEEEEDEDEEEDDDEEESQDEHEEED